MSVDPQELLDWVDDGLCRGEDPELFYPERGASTAPAKAICAECPVKQPCLAWALAHEALGVWGGTSGRERRRLRRMAGLKVETPGGWLTEDEDQDVELGEAS